MACSSWKSDIQHPTYYKTSQEQSESIHNIEVCSEKYVHLYSEASSSSLAHQVG